MVVVALVAAVVANGCGTVPRSERGPQPPYVELATGRYRAYPWVLYAVVDYGSLCFTVTRPGERPHFDRYEICTFKPHEAESTYWGGERGPGGSTLILGPLPASASTVVISPTIRRPTWKFPSKGDLPKARYWYFFASPSQVRHLY